jgi:hypothetical protein
MPRQAITPRRVTITGHRPGEQLKQIEAEGGSNTITRRGEFSTKAFVSSLNGGLCLVIAAEIGLPPEDNGALESNPLGA